MKKIRIILINIGYRQPVFPLLSPPLGIMYIAAYLRSRFDADIRLINQKERNIPDDVLVKQVIDFKPDVVGLGALTPTAGSLASLTRKIRAGIQDVLILVGGPHVSAFGANVLRGTEANAAVPGEGEFAVEMLINSYFNGRAFSEIPGIFWKDGEDVISNEGKLPFIEDLDSLPFPAYDLIDLPFYWGQQSFPPIPRRKYISLFSSRGCPYGCIYCHKIFGRKFRYHSVGRIIEEIRYYHSLYGINDIEFLDDVFNLNKDRLKDFCVEFPGRELKMKLAFPNGVRTDLLNEDDIRALVESGLYYSSFALESGSDRIQKLMHKNLDIKKFVKNVEIAASLGVFCNGFSMLGFPTETREEMYETVDTACNSKLHTCSFFTVTPFPNTELYDMVEKTAPDKLKNINYNDMEYADVKINLSAEPDAVLFKTQREANRKFYLKPSRIVRIIRDFPKPYLLPLYVPVVFKRITKGILSILKS